VRGELVIAPVPGQERDLPPGDLADHDAIARRAERGLHRHLVGRREELIKPRAADYPDAGQAGHVAQATFEPDDEDEDEDPDEPADEEEPDEPEEDEPEEEEPEEEEPEDEEPEDEADLSAFLSPDDDPLSPDDDPPSLPASDEPEESELAESEPDESDPDRDEPEPDPISALSFERESLR
jgi:hypothetical protein